MYWRGSLTEQQIHNSVFVRVGRCFTEQQIHNSVLGSIGGCFTEQQIHNGVLVSIGGDVLLNNKYTMVF